MVIVLAAITASAAVSNERTDEFMTTPWMH
jgi:hypothetical protein